MTDLGASHIEKLEIEERKLSRIFNGHNFSHECTILGHNISRRLQLNNGCSREIPMVITFHMDVRLRSIIYRDTRHLTTDALEKLKWS